VKSGYSRTTCSKVFVKITSHFDKINQNAT
jgi:hypothetical protein